MKFFFTFIILFLSSSFLSVNRATLPAVVNGKILLGDDKPLIRGDWMWPISYYRDREIYFRGKKGDIVQFYVISNCKDDCDNLDGVSKFALQSRSMFILPLDIGLKIKKITKMSRKKFLITASLQSDLKRKTRYELIPHYHKEKSGFWDIFKKRKFLPLAGSIGIFYPNRSNIPYGKDFLKQFKTVIRTSGRVDLFLEFSKAEKGPFLIKCTSKENSSLFSMQYFLINANKTSIKPFYLEFCFNDRIAYDYRKLDVTLQRIHPYTLEPMGKTIIIN